MTATVTGAMIADEYGVSHDEMNEILHICRDYLGRMPRQAELRPMLDTIVPHVEPGWRAAAIAVWIDGLLERQP